ncbi:hypothetical protein HQ865_09275 [Mucilaginibacter mali]|uniref:DUF2306 domain-containing protein n=1 Tax=Mucilaginibacter mali TaxID=2740462 RepID=A0A7D4UAG7_9SPHI|nr:hypothetical protein [Mucilaginibacter mali]QKJ29938.1 hypothetical protein HQ865_09275 [Mucilaginibacter mali]
MPNHLSTLGIIHTAISILAIGSALVALPRYGKIDPKTSPGKWYIGLTILTCLTALPIMRTGHPTPGHPLAIIILVLLPIGIYAKAIPVLKKKGDYTQAIILSLTLFLSMVPATVETLTRVPLSGPIAASDQDPIVKTTLGIIFIIFLIGVTYQTLKIKARKKATVTPDNSMHLS